MSELDVSSNEQEIKAIVEEFRIDYNRDHFIRDKEFLTFGTLLMKIHAIYSLSF